MADGEYSNKSKQDLLDAIDYAYDKVDGSWEYESYLETVMDYLDAQ